MSKSNKEQMEFIKNASLQQLKDENVLLDEICILSIKCNEYKIEGEHLIGIGKSEKINIEKMFSNIGDLQLIFDILNLAHKFDKDENVKKEWKEIFSDNKTTYNKTYVRIDFENLPDEKKQITKKFFEKYGIVSAKNIMENGLFKYNLNFFMRRVFEFFYTFKIWDSIIKKKIYDEELKKYLIILPPQFRRIDKDILYEGVINNIQEKGLIGEEKNQYSIFERMYYDRKIQAPTIQTLSNDYITLAYHQLGHVIVDKHNGIPFRTCKYCGSILEYERSSKECCNSEECRKIRQRDNTRRYREKNKNKEN